MKKRTDELFILTLVPLLCGLVLAGLLIYVAFIQRADYADITWESLFGDIMPFYLGIVVFFMLVNILYCTRAICRERYNFMRNMFYTGAGFCFALIVLFFWINA